MRIKTEHWNQNLPLVSTVQLAFLLIMGVVEFLNMTQGAFPRINVHLLTNAGIMLSLLGLWAVTVCRNPRSVMRRDVILGLVMVLWFLIVEANRRINHTPLQSLTIFLAVYLIALPFAALAQDQDRQLGIRLISGFYLAGALLMMTFGLVLLAGGTLPGALGSQVYWDGPRLFVIHHPNVTSRIFMIALALCMGFLGQARKLWVKVMMLLAAVLLFAAIALTNCRAVILVSCCILAGNVFSEICSKNRKYLLLGIAAAIAVAAVLFVASSQLYQWNLTRLINQASQQTMQEQILTAEVPDLGLTDSANEVILPAETPLSAPPEWKLEGNGNSSQPPLLYSIPTLNGRTAIWAAVFQKIKDDPMILLRGVIDNRLVLTNMHTHNAWLESLFVLGLPGFLLVLVFTLHGIWASLRLIWFSGVSMFRKNIALLTIATMAAAMLEPCLFATYLEWSFSDFFFFLCLGYLTLWSKQIPAKK